MTCPYGRMVVIKLNGTDGGNCVMEEDQLLIGRDPEQCDIVIRLPEVSKMQAKLSADDENQVWLENLSQTNPGGTMVNESRVDKPTLLDDQDIISICGRRFRFEYGNSDMLDATIAISSYVPAPGSAKKVTSVKKVASVKKATKDEKPKENKETENKAITPSKPTLQAEQRKLSNGARTPLDEVREALKARREALAGKSTTPSPAPTPSKSPAGLIKQAKSPRNNPCEAAKTSSTGFRPVISADELKNALAARRSSAMGPPPARVAGTPKGTFDCGELEKALRKRMSSEVLQSPVQPNLAQPLTGGKPTNTKSVTKPPSARHTDEDISDRGDAEPIAAFVLEAAAQAPAVTRSVLPSPLKRQIMARRPPSTGGNSTSGSAHSHRNSVGPSPLKVLTMARLPTPLREAIQGRRQSVESAVAFAPEASNPSINGTPTRVEPTPEKQPSSTVKGALRVTFGDVPNSARKSVRVSFGPQASPGVAPERRGRYAMPTPVRVFVAPPPSPSSEPSSLPLHTSMGVSAEEMVVQFDEAMSKLHTPTGSAKQVKFFLNTDEDSNENDKDSLRSTWEQTPGGLYNRRNPSMTTPSSASSMQSSVSHSDVDECCSTRGSTASVKSALNALVVHGPGDEATPNAKAVTRKLVVTEKQKSVSFPQEGCPAEDIVKEPVRLSTDQTPGRRFGTREQTPTTAGAANSASTSVMLKEAVNAKFTPEAASIVHHLMEGEFSPMQPVQTSSSNVMSIVGVFSLRKASAASEATTNVVASPCPPGGRVNKHERFGSPGSIARRLESRSAWIAKLDMKLDAKDQVIANPDRLTLLHQCTDNVGEYTSSDWAEWELKEYEAWEENEWAHSALQDTDCNDGDATLKNVHIRFSGTPSMQGSPAASMEHTSSNDTPSWAIDPRPSPMDESPESAQVFGVRGVWSTAIGPAPNDANMSVDNENATPGSVFVHSNCSITFHDGNDTKLLAEDDEGALPICRLFGTPSVASSSPVVLSPGEPISGTFSVIDARESQSAADVHRSSCGSARRESTCSSKDLPRVVRGSFTPISASQAPDQDDTSHRVLGIFTPWASDEMQVAFEPRCFWAEASVSDFHGASEPMSTEKPPKSVDERGDCVSEVVLISECEGSLKKEVLQKALLAELDAPLSSLPLSDMEAPGVGNNPETFRQRRLSTSVEALANAQIGESNATDITSADVQLGGDLQATKSTSIKKTPNPASVKKMSTPASVKNPSAPASLKKTSTPASVKKVPSCERAPEVEPSSVKEMSIPMPKEPASVKKNSIPAPEEPASVKKASSPAFIDQMSTPAPEEAASVKKALNPASIKKAPTPASAKKAPTPASSNKALTSAFISRVVTPSPEEPASVKKAPTPASIGRVSAPASDEPASVRKESTPAPEKIASVKKEPTPTSVKKAAATALEEVAPVKKAGTPASIKKAHAHEIAVPASTDKAPTPIHEVPRSVEKAPTPKLVKKAVTPASVKQAATPAPEESTSVRESSTPAPSGELMSQNGEITFRESEEADAHLETTLQTQIYASLSNMSDEDVRALKVTELRRLLTDLNLSSLGKKVELVQRLLEQRKEVNTEAQHLLDKSTEFEHVPRIRAMKRKAASADSLSVEDEVSSKGKARKVDSVRDSQEKELRPRGKKRLEAPMDEPQAPSRRRQTKS